MTIPLLTTIPIRRTPPIKTGIVTFMRRTNIARITPIEANGIVNMITNGSVSDSN
jgi:hypothetical protein